MTQEYSSMRMVGSLFGPMLKYSRGSTNAHVTHDRCKGGSYYGTVKWHDDARYVVDLRFTGVGLRCR